MPRIFSRLSRLAVVTVAAIVVGTASAAPAAADPPPSWLTDVIGQSGTGSLGTGSGPGIGSGGERGRFAVGLDVNTLPPGERIRITVRTLEVLDDCVGSGATVASRYAGPTFERILFTVLASQCSGAEPVVRLVGDGATTAGLPAFTMTITVRPDLQTTCSVAGPYTCRKTEAAALNGGLFLIGVAQP
ncbi:hypothetical protein [Gordonia soli]|uniref:Uncharacterized protein n=1 Tax=Gordonia soli NBRC 108243 TaxID=1223545 RepID=M0QG96_9ACTN|nr:hypothetical protein [Gordonia soli]GAC67469.1 hypothetical protein GS4_08_00530 [Gordonia soli NBRC 108243]